MDKEPMELLDEALADVGLVTKNVSQTLFGIDKEIKKAALGMFTMVAYTREDVDDSGTKILYKDYAPAPVIMTARHGVGKTDLARNMAFSIGGRFSFVSGQPEMSASKIMGRDLYVAGQFFFAVGDIYVHVFLFDELPRTPPKVLAPFFQTLEERQAIVDTYDMKLMKVVNKRISLTPINEDDPTDKRLFFWAISTGNPFEHEGSYEVPEAMWDRYAIHFGIDYPDRESEKLIDSKNVCGVGKPVIKPVISLERAHAIGLFFAKNVEIRPDAMEYIQRLTENSRPGEKDKEERRIYAPRSLRNDIDRYAKAGASPRYNYHYKAIVRTLAAFHRRLYVTIDDVKEAYPLVAAHRILLNRTAVGRNITQHEMANEILRLTPVPVSGSRSMVSLSGNPGNNGFWNRVRSFARS